VWAIAGDRHALAMAGRRLTKAETQQAGPAEEVARLAKAWWPGHAGCALAGGLAQCARHLSSADPGSQRSFPVDGLRRPVRRENWASRRWPSWRELWNCRPQVGDAWAVCRPMHRAVSSQRRESPWPRRQAVARRFSGCGSEVAVSGWAALEHPFAAMQHRRWGLDRASTPPPAPPGHQHLGRH